MRTGYSHVAMRHSGHDTPAATDTDLRPVLEWLAQAYGEDGHLDDAEPLLEHLHVLRASPVGTARRLQVLDLFFAHQQRLINRLIPQILKANLPLPRRLRSRVNLLHGALEVQAQEYQNTLSELFDPRLSLPSAPPVEAVIKALRCLAWSIDISHLCHAPPRVGIWQQFHGCFATARQLGIEHHRGLRDPHSPARIYMAALMRVIAQPAAFTAEELLWMIDYLNSLPELPNLYGRAGHHTQGVFWLAADRDQPPQAVARRQPPPELPIDYFDASRVAAAVQLHLQYLQAGRLPSALRLPDFAGTSSGQMLLGRLARAWGNPARRKFPRRRHTFRLRLHGGLPLPQEEQAEAEWSEWMVTNESPDGYALMHVSGQLGRLALGQVASLHYFSQKPEETPGEQPCLVRWILSENPEHLEIGVQLLTPHAYPATAVQPARGDAARRLPVLVLPPAPPVRLGMQLLAPAEGFSPKDGRLIIVAEQERVSVREYELGELEEQMGQHALWNIKPDETP